MRKKYTIFYFILFFLYIHASAQTGGIRGTTLSDKGERLPFVGIYIKNIHSGFSSNLDSKFEIKLPPGEYNLVVQCLGYKPEQQIVKVANDWVDLNLILTPTTYSLQEVKIGSRDEDPAYAIMRKAISMAKFYQYQVQEYSSKAYIKGFVKLKHVPWVVRKLDKKKDLDTSKIYLIESVSELSFKQPNIYKEKIISISSNLDEKFPSPMTYIKGSFYEPVIGSVISPLSPRAFSYYSFKLEGSFYEDDRQIYKIRVIPRFKGDDVFEGTIYIVDNLWCIRSVNVALMHDGITTIITQIYNEVQDKVWMPLTQSYIIYGSVLGFGFEGKYQATTNDYKIKLNETLHIPVEIIDEKTEKEKIVEATPVKSKNEKDVQDLLQGDKKFTNKDMRKLLKMYEEEEAKKLEDPDITSDETLEIDSMAYKRDSLFWAEERAIPLTQREVRSYEVKDSLAVIMKAKSEGDSAKAKQNSSVNLNTALEYQFRIDSTSWISALLEANYNTVEGYVFAAGPTYHKKFRNKDRFSIAPVVRYSAARNYFNGKGTINYQYGIDKASGNVSAEGGRYISQVNPNNPISYALNTLTTLVFESNFMKIYEKEYYKVSVSQRVTNKIFFALNGEFVNRYFLSNSAKLKPTVNWKNNSFTSNSPINTEIASTAFLTNQAFLTQASLRYYLWKKYKISNGVKSEIENSSPEIYFNYQKGWKGTLGSDVDFDLLETGIKYQRKLRARGLLDANINCGGFINTNKMYFTDFKHFMGHRTIIQKPLSGYRMLDYYKYSTHRYFAEGLLYFQVPKLLVTQFALPRVMGLKENIFLNYLYTPSSNNYMEVGYGLDKIFRFLRLEVVSSFENFQYQSIGFRIGFSAKFGAVNFD